MVFDGDMLNEAMVVDEIGGALKVLVQSWSIREDALPLAGEGCSLKTEIEANWVGRGLHRKAKGYPFRS